MKKVKVLPCWARDGRVYGDLETLRAAYRLHTTNILVEDKERPLLFEDARGLYLSTSGHMLCTSIVPFVEAHGGAYVPPGQNPFTEEGRRIVIDRL